MNHLFNLNLKEEKVGIYIPFSGGFDSTALILDIITQLDKDNIYDIYLISIPLCFTRNKTLRENKAREDIISYINSMRLSDNISIQELSITMNYIENKHFYIRKNGMALQQIYSFISSLCIDLNRYDKNYLLLSFICGDQICSFEKEIRNIVYNNLSILNSCSSIDRIMKCAKVIFPYKLTYKEQIIKFLIEYEKKYKVSIIEYCSCCESINKSIDNCGHCNPCKALKGALINLYIDISLKKDIRDRAYEILKTRFNNTSYDEIRLLRKFNIVEEEVIKNEEQINIIDEDEENNMPS